ncbi:MAG: hypothetical protein LBS52_05905 [Dysgonamonadaceae bacterium]|jgi:hypothetical protein|nr:hypothetical protein [Dysgonamonadaceae bacterium]
MGMGTTKRSFIVFLTLFIAVCGAVGAVIFRVFLPERYFEAYPLIPVFFYLMGLFSISVFEVFRRKHPQKLTLFYMAEKVVKLLLSIVVILLYCVVVKNHEKEFILTFVGFYFLYLIVETGFFFKFELNQKNKLSK